jgi:hypothetical protein
MSIGLLATLIPKTHANLFEALVSIIAIVVSIIGIIISIVAVIATDYANFALGFFSGSKAQWPNANEITLFTRNEALHYTAMSVRAMNDVIIIGKRRCRQCANQAG